MKLKTYPLVCSAVLAVSVPFAAFAETYTVTGAGNLSTKTWDPSTPTAETPDIDIVWHTDSNGQTLTWNVDWSAYDVRSFTFGGVPAADANNGINPRLNLSYDLNISGDFFRSQVGGGNHFFRIYGANAALSIGGDVTSYGAPGPSLSFGNDGNDAQALKSLYVGGDVTTAGVDGNLNEGSGLRFNVTEGATIAGRLLLYANSHVIFNQSTSSTGISRSVRVGGLSGAASNTIVAGEIGNDTVRNNSAYLTFTGMSTDQTYSGIVRNRHGTQAAGNTSTGKLHFIMDAGNASFTQTLSGANSYTGDTVLRQGNLKFNAATTSIGNVYLGYGVTRHATTDVVTGIVAEENAETSIIFDGAGATVNDFNWSSGLVKVILSAAAESTAVVTVDGDFTFSNADAFNFIFEDLTEGTTYKLFATTTDLSTYLSKFDSNYGNGFRYENNELIFNTDYVIPEPAEVALLLGAVAFGGALYARRRKKV